MKQTEILTHATHVNGWEPAVYMRCMSQNFRFFHVSNSSVRNFRIFLFMYPGSLASLGGTAERARGCFLPVLSVRGVVIWIDTWLRPPRLSLHRLSSFCLYRSATNLSWTRSSPACIGSAFSPPIFTLPLPISRLRPSAPPVWAPLLPRNSIRCQVKSLFL